MPNIQDLFDRLQGKTIFSSLDFHQAFYQVPIHPEDCEKTTIVLPFGAFMFQSLPMGIANSPATFQAVMNNVFEGLDFVLTYIDDLVIASTSPEEHEKHLRIVLERLQIFKLFCKLKKCTCNRTDLK